MADLARGVRLYAAKQKLDDIAHQRWLAYRRDASTLQQYNTARADRDAAAVRLRAFLDERPQLSMYDIQDAFAATFPMRPG